MMLQSQAKAFAGNPLRSPGRKQAEKTME